MEKFQKVDLHLHLDGSVSCAVLEYLAAENGYHLGQQSIRQAAAAVKCENLKEYLKCFDFILTFLQTAPSLTLAVYELIQRLDREGLVYAEIRFAPQLHTLKGLTQQAAVEAVLEGVRKAESTCVRMKTGILLCMMVIGKDSDNMQTAELSSAYRHQGVVGLDLAGAEGAVPIQHFEPLFKEAYKMDVPFTIHAGECGSYENIAKAVSYGAKRIGHGCGAVFSEACMNLLKREKIVVEACLTSNLQTKAVTSLGEHPIRRFYDEGILVTVNTDNMTVSNTNLDNEYRLLKENLGFTDMEIKKMNETALKAAFFNQ